MLTTDARRQGREQAVDSYAQRALDAAVLRQAILDVRLRTSGSHVPLKERRERKRTVLQAARWLFVNNNPQHVFSPQQICQRLGVDASKLLCKCFEKLPAQRRKYIRGGLRRFRTILPVA